MEPKKVSRLKFVIAGDSRRSIEERCGIDAWRTLADNGFVEKTSVSCVGFQRDIEKNTLLVVLPKAFDTPEARSQLDDPTFERGQIYQLIRLFKKIRQQTSFAINRGETNKLLERERLSSDPVLDSFDAALRLRRDYRENGLYRKKSARQVYNNHNLPINWPQTIRRSNAVINGRSINFDNTVHGCRKHEPSHPLCQLHIACLQEIFSLTGERSDLAYMESLDSRAFQKIKAKPRNHLRALSSATFDERGRFLIRAIGSYLGEAGLLNTPQKVQDELLSFSRDFENIWEKMLRDLMTPGSPSRKLPPGQWHAWPNADERRGIRPQVDIQLSEEDTNLLVDAKDYRLMSGGKWKGSAGDHYKQIIYRKLFSTSTSSKVLNILAFPAVGQTSLFVVRGCHDWTEIVDSRVFEITVDYNLVAKRWLGESTLDVAAEIRELLASLRNFNDKLD